MSDFQVQPSPALERVTAEITEHLDRVRESDPVNSPSHYTSGGIECIDGIEAALSPEEFSGFLKGNALKYIWRAGKKGDYLEDIRKARWYLDREIDTAIKAYGPRQG